MLILSWIIFIAFSMGCATAKGMIELYESRSRCLLASQLTFVGFAAERFKVSGRLVFIVSPRLDLSKLVRFID